MTLPHPLQKLVGCCWLPRLADKTRVYLRGEMPLSYRLAFGSSIGVDGYFLRHFRLSPEQIIVAVRAATDNDALARWFLTRPAVTPESISAWNDLAPRLGTKGHPGYVTRHIVKWIFYPESILRPVGSLFEAIIQDEALTR